ncbi:MAG: hypothetical protein QNJ41_20050 [Xenococcaceae cyanobacterium MO_188.B32]|nr:hypothetical protein [Xenococcaceae cyanobacterium MO_188.B32]
MIEILVLLALTKNITCSPAFFLQTNNLPLFSVVETIMLSAKDIFIKSVTLLARETITPPDGVPPQLNRDIGFATVFIRLENAKEENAIVTIKNIEIRNASDDTLQPFIQSPQEIYLKPLENSKISFDLTNKTGYIGRDKVKAVVTYQIGEQTKVIESEPVEVDRY